MKRIAFAVAAVTLAACSSAPIQQTLARPPIPVCDGAPEGTLSPQIRDTVAAYRRAVETGPLFSASASRAGVASCRITVDTGAVSLAYQFRDGGWLHAKRDSPIESSDQEVRFVRAPSENPLAILTRAERAAFGDQGCGLDWKGNETQPTGDGTGAVESIYRGDTCNCQARVRRDTAGRVMGLTLRSAC